MNQAPQISSYSTTMHRIASLIAMLSISAGVLVLIGWALDISVLKSILPIWVAMKANTAVCFILIGIALLSSSLSSVTPEARFSRLHFESARLFGMLVALIGLLTLCEYIFGWDLGIDQLLFLEPAGAVGTSHPGRMAPETALCFIFLAIALSFGSFSRKRRWITIASASIGLVVTSLALSAILSYLTPQLGAFGWFGFTIMAMHTALLFGILSTVIALLRWQQDVQSWVLSLSITLAFAVGIFMLVVSGLTISRTQSWLEHTKSQMGLAEQKQNDINNILIGVIKVQTGTRGFIVSGNEKFLTAYISDKAHIDTMLSELRQIDRVSAAPIHQGHVSKIEALINKQYRWHQQVIAATQTALSDTSRIDMLRQGEVIQEIILSEFKSIDKEHNLYIENLKRESASASSFSYKLIVGSTFLSMLIFIGALLRLNFIERVRKELETALKKQVVELRTINQELDVSRQLLLQSEKLAAIGQLAAGVAHEINNPVSFVQSNFGSLAEYVDDLLVVDAAYREAEVRLSAQDPQAFERVQQTKLKVDYDFIIGDMQKLVSESREGLDRVRRIVRDLKDFARVGEAEWQWADLHQGIDSTFNIVANEINYKAEVRREYGDLPLVRCIPAQLNQVFMNLLVNAAQSIVANGHITIRTACNEHQVWVEVQDDGRGISPENVQHIFDPFFTTKPIGDGTGLGLSLSWGIVQRHKGKITVESEQGKGATFRVTLPIDLQAESTENKVL